MLRSRSVAKAPQAWQRAANEGLDGAERQAGVSYDVLMGEPRGAIRDHRMGWRATARAVYSDILIWRLLGKIG